MSEHYYTLDGTARHFVPRSDGTGTRPTTLRDAKKLGLVPSVTGILNILRKPGLERYFIQQAVQAVCTAPDVPGEPLDAKIVRVLETEKQQDEEAAAARDLGTAIHASLEAMLSGGKPAVECIPYVEPAEKAVRELGTIYATERIVIGEGYGGRVDCIMRSPTGGLVVLDFKTAKKLPDKGAWPEHRLQLALYAEAIELMNLGNVSDVGNIYISTTTPGEIKVYTWRDWVKDAAIGAMLVKIWQWQTGYIPPKTL